MPFPSNRRVRVKSILETVLKIFGEGLKLKLDKGGENRPEKPNIRLAAGVSRERACRSVILVRMFPWLFWGEDLSFFSIPTIFLADVLNREVESGSCVGQLLCAEKFLDLGGSFTPIVSPPDGRCVRSEDHRQLFGPVMIDLEDHSWTSFQQLKSHFFGIFLPRYTRPDETYARIRAS